MPSAFPLVLAGVGPLGAHGIQKVLRTSTQLVRSRPQSWGAVRCRFVFRMGRSISPGQNPAYRRSRPTFCIPKTQVAGRRLRSLLHLNCSPHGRVNAQSMLKWRPTGWLGRPAQLGGHAGQRSEDRTTSKQDSQHPFAGSSRLPTRSDRPPRPDEKPSAGGSI